MAIQISKPLMTDTTGLEVETKTFRNAVVSKTYILSPTVFFLWEKTMLVFIQQRGHTLPELGRTQSHPPERW